MEIDESLHEEVICAFSSVTDVSFVRKEHCYPIRKDEVDLLYTTYIWE